MNEMYVLFNCDEWKTYSSFRFVGVFDKEGLYKVIKEKIKTDDYESSLEIEAIDDCFLEDLKTNVDFAYIEKVELNKVLA